MEVNGGAQLVEPPAILLSADSASNRCSTGRSKPCLRQSTVTASMSAGSLLISVPSKPGRASSYALASHRSKLGAGPLQQ
jgi:hypothetical protein